MGDYVLTLKRNQPELDREVREYFEMAEEEDFDRPEIAHEATSEEGHGRIEHRSYFLSTDLSSLSGIEKWSGLKAIGMVESERHSGGRVSMEQRYFITSLGDVKVVPTSGAFALGHREWVTLEIGCDIPRRRKPDSSRQWSSQYRNDSACGDELAQAR